ncbi:hypothetical protein [Tumidithrix helvetica]|uniref:hypothetical protein n=1 Tax=Tumidithrix helvetica TaxID=3457545 RepID=UPI003CC5AFB2
MSAIVTQVLNSMSDRPFTPTNQRSPLHPTNQRSPLTSSMSDRPFTPINQRSLPRPKSNLKKPIAPQILNSKSDRLLPYIFGSDEVSSSRS